MARGWESKSVEAQQEEASRARSVSPALTDAQRATLDRRRTLELARAKTQDDLSRATVPAYRQMLEHALGEIEKQLAELGL